MKKSTVYSFLLLTTTLVNATPIFNLTGNMAQVIYDAYAVPGVFKGACCIVKSGQGLFSCKAQEKTIFSSYQCTFPQLNLTEDSAKDIFEAMNVAITSTELNYQKKEIVGQLVCIRKEPWTYMPTYQCALED